ncbi:3-oxoacyl-ACP synthase [Streptomyces filipinensis]|uniref:3-oxoacyl-ACP synthase n=1 Tax=Streptomyces filipinensis TaxID=66887 RepID=A0A918MD42_9ACTN|nr:beta-ketoacyl-ACP synthase II [Streptomyces filipinensis]GGV13130.1 3-oxoacyl-ACP synthase [Streptomyces filipinensis]
MSGNAAQHDIVVTGVGATTPLGGDAPSTWAAMLAGESGVTSVTAEWAEPLPVRIAARLRTDPGEALPRVEARRMDRCEQIALLSAREAWADAGTPDVDPERLAVVIGTGIGGVSSLLAQNHTLEQQGPRRVSPFAIPMLMANSAAARVSIDLGARAGARTPVSACSSAAEAIAMAVDLIRLDRADIVVAGGTEAGVLPLPLAAFAQMTALSKRNDDPAGASRPFDAARDGFVLGEGGAVLVLERAEFARARGARPIAAVAGAGISSNAGHITASDVEGQVRAIRMALREGGLSPQDIGFVQAHATATPTGDLEEAEAIHEAIGHHSAISAIKSMTGHLLGASGAVASLAAVYGLRDGIAPAIRNLDHPDPAVKLDLIAGTPRAGRWDAALVNSFAFGGHNVSVAFTRT